MFDPTGEGVPVDDEVRDLADLIRELSTTDITAADTDTLASLTRSIKRIAGFIDVCTAAVAQRAATLHAAGHAAAPSEFLSRHAGLSQREARRAQRRAEALAQAPAITSALHAGAITGAHADALADTTASLTPELTTAFYEHDAELANAAATLSPERFTETCRRIVDSLRDDDGASLADQARRETRCRKYVNPRTNLYHLQAVLDPELGAAVFAAIDREASALFHAADPGHMVEALRYDNDHVAGHAVANLIRGGRSRRGGISAEITVLIDHHTLINGVHEVSTCETGDGQPLPLATVRRLACTADLLPAVLTGDSELLDLGRARRLANRAQRRALRAMFPTCVGEHCQTPFQRCDIHHLTPFEHGGNTNIGDLRPLCHQHHHHAHEGQWTITALPHYGTRFTRPDGHHHTDTYPPNHNTPATPATSATPNIAPTPATPASPATPNVATPNIAPDPPAPPPGPPPGQPPGPPPDANHTDATLAA